MVLRCYGRVSEGERNWPLLDGLSECFGWGGGQPAGAGEGEAWFWGQGRPGSVNSASHQGELQLAVVV